MDSECVLGFIVLSLTSTGSDSSRIDIIHGSAEHCTRLKAVCFVPI